MSLSIQLFLSHGTWQIWQISFSVPLEHPRIHIITKIGQKSHLDIPENSEGLRSPWKSMESIGTLPHMEISSKGY